MAIRIHREDDLSHERPTRRADIDRDRMVFKCSLPFGIRWLFRLDRTFRRRDAMAERTFRLLLALILLTAVLFAAVVSVMALSA